MDRRGSALDNAVIEFWHSTLKFELRMLEHFTTTAQARSRVAAWIAECNHDRRHSALGMHSSVDYKLTHQKHDHELDHPEHPEHERPESPAHQA